MTGVAVVLCSIFGVAQAREPSDGLDDLLSFGGVVAEWHLDEGHGDFSADASGLGNDLTLGTTPGATDGYEPAWVSGFVGSALSFTVAPRFAYATHDGSLETPYVTVEAWIARDAAPGTLEPIVEMGAHNCYSGAYGLRMEGNTVAFYVFDGTQYHKASGPIGGLADGAYHHVAGTYDGTEVQVFVDGTEVGSLPASVAIAYDRATHPPLLVGAYGGVQCTFAFLGDVDEVTIFDYALTDGQIAERAGAVATF